MVTWWTTTEDDVNFLWRLVPTYVAPPSHTPSPRTEPSVGESRPGGGQLPLPVLQRNQSGLAWRELQVEATTRQVSLAVTLHVSTITSATRLWHNQLTVISHCLSHCPITRVNVQVLHDCDRVHALSFLTDAVPLHLSTYTCQRTRVNVHVSHDCDRVHSLSSLTVILHMSTYVSQDSGIVHSLLIFTVTLHVSTYKSHTTVTESTHYIQSPS